MLPILDQQLLHQLGDRLRRLRKERALGTVALAELAGISRPTLRAVETGDPNTSIGVYLRVMSALGLSGELALLTSDALIPSAPNMAAARSRSAQPVVTVTVCADRSSSDLHDLQSLALHRVAYELMKKDDELRLRALETVHSWQQNKPNSRSAALWTEWERILGKKALSRILGRSARAQQLRQASPLATILPADLRQSILEEVSQLKRGITVAGPPYAPS
jgi:transcriptional regulator with XRE-family HTH domain